MHWTKGNLGWIEVIGVHVQRKKRGADPATAARRDCALPECHTTVQFNGWTGPNPNNYTTQNTIHWKMEELFVAANLKDLPFANLVPPGAQKWTIRSTTYLAPQRHSYALVEKCYQLEKEGGFDGPGTPGFRQVIEQRLAAGATMLRNLCVVVHGLV